MELGPVLREAHGKSLPRYVEHELRLDLSGRLPLSSVGGAVDWESRKKERLAAIAALYADIESWLGPSKAEGIVTLSREPCELHERHMGVFMSESLALQVGNSTVQFRPVAANVAGATARVDMLSGPRSITLVHLPDRLGWSFLVRAAGVRTLPVNEESFVDMLKDLLDE